MMKTANTNDNIRRFNFGGAMSDATQQKAYPAKKVWMKDVRNLPITYQVVNDYLDMVLSGYFTSQDEHDCYFNVTCWNICEEINTEADKRGITPRFGFGNAQKLLNMMVKHTYAVTYNNEALKENFRFCHCPMDSIMLNLVWHRKDELGIEDDIKKIGGKNIFLAPWSKESFDDITRYETYQKAIRKLCTGYTTESGRTINSVEFDYNNWNIEEV